MAHTTKANNRHKAHATHCQTCGRALPKRAFRRECASCIKVANGYERTLVAARLKPGLVTEYHLRWRKRVAEVA